MVKPVFVPRAASVTNEIRVNDKFVIATAHFRWQAQKGQVLPLLFEPAVLTGVKYPKENLKLIRGGIRVPPGLADAGREIRRF